MKVGRIEDFGEREDNWRSEVLIRWNIEVLRFEVGIFCVIGGEGRMYEEVEI